MTEPLAFQLNRQPRGCSSYTTWLLPLARQEWRYESRHLAAAPGLTEDQRRVLAPLVRRYAVENASYSAEPARTPRLVLVLLGVVLVFGIPAFLAWSFEPKGVLQPVGATTFTVVVVLVAAAVWSVRRPRLVVWLATSSFVLWIAANLTVGLPRILPGPQPAIAIGTTTALGAALAIYVCETVVQQVARYLSWPRVTRRTSVTLQPDQRTAVYLASLLAGLGGTGAPWRSASDRRLVTGWVDFTVRRLERSMGYEIWAVGSGRDERRQAVRRRRHAAAALRAIRPRFAEAYTREAYERLCTEIAESAAAVAAGNWGPLTQQEEPRAYEQYRPLLRRFGPALVLLGAALAVTAVPGAPAAGTASLQVVLIVTAVLSLTGVDSGTRDTIVQAYRDAGKTSG